MSASGPQPERLQKVLAAAGVASRRGAEDLISAGRVTIDGRRAVLGEQVVPSEVAIAVDGVPLRGAARPIHLVMHKPAGVTSTVRDRHAASTVLDLVPAGQRGEGTRLYPVGRLDKDSEGLLLLTNDGAWAERVLHPRHETDREYAIAVGAPLDARQARALEGGIELEEGTATLRHLRPMTSVELRRLAALLEPRPEPGLTWYRATLRQGWKRQLRRMFGAVGAPIRRLVRVRMGSVRLDDLPSGAVRPLSPEEVRALGTTAGRSRRGA